MWIFTKRENSVTILKIKLTLQQELERMKDQFMHEIRELNERLHAAELAKEQFDHKQSGRSFLGDFQDDEVERENIREQREQLAMMKEKLQDRVNIYKYINFCE